MRYMKDLLRLTNRDSAGAEVRLDLRRQFAGQ